MIPARAGSKRFPRKNVALFRGRPLVALAVDVALESGVFARVVVSTDDDEVERLSAEAGAQIRRRPPALATDSVPLEPVLLDARDWLAAQGDTFDVGAMMLTTSPLRLASDVRDAYRRFVESGGDSLMIVSRYFKTPFQALEERDGFGRLMFESLARQQPQPPVWVDTGMAYFSRLDALERERTFYGSRMVMWEVPVQRSVDVDEPYHLKMAAALAGGLESETPRGARESQPVPTLRRATPEDASAIFEWRNDPAVYHQFFSPAPVAWEEHHRWIENVVKDPSRHLLIAEHGGGPVGVVRLDQDAAAVEISLYVVPVLQGLGWGTAMLSAAKQWARAHTGARSMRARVLDGNVRSAALFERSGFVRTSHTFECAL